MGMGTRFIGKTGPIYERRGTLHWQKSPHIWAWGQFAVAKWAPNMDMGTLCNGKKTPIYGHGDILHWQKGPHIWA